MNAFKKAKWIYADCAVGEDQYTEYVDSLERIDAPTYLYICADSDYAVFINGTYVASGQYRDFEHYKIYDTLEISAYLTEEVNRVRILHYYCGVDTQTYRRGVAGLLYEIVSGDRTLAYSDESTQSRLSPSYANGKKRFVSSQLGFTFAYDATQDGEDGYRSSVAVEKHVRLFPRPIPRMAVLPRREMQAISQIDDHTYLIDMGEEVVGFASLDFVSPCVQSVCVSYGESLEPDGHVRALIGGRSFCFDYVARTGQNIFTDYMLRLACRYLEVRTEAPIDIRYVGILPQVCEVEEKKCCIDSPRDREIYDICVNTLRLCMMEHYVDTPWREQCLYAFDSRNQMLCGYYAFKDGNRDYARANLKLIGEDRRADGLLSICYPCGTALAIPSFSLYYILAMREYMDYTGDATLAAEYAEKIEGILDEFLRNEREGLIVTFEGAQMWNFYDWSPYLSGSLSRSETTHADLVINSLFVMALDAYARMCERIGRPFRYGTLADEMCRRIADTFSDATGMLSHREGSAEYTSLGNALAILCGAVTGEAARKICDCIVRGEATPSSLSMNIWKYEALLLTDRDAYEGYVLDEIRVNYGKMLDAGSTTVWETAGGSVDFGNAGSLCHGWSAVPIYVFHKLGLAVPEK